MCYAKIVGLNKLVDELQGWSYSPDEMLQTRIARKINHKSVEKMGNVEINAKVHNLKCAWICKYDKRNEIRGAYKRLRDDDPTERCDVLVAVASVMTDNEIWDSKDLDSLKISDFNKLCAAAGEKLGVMIQEQTDRGDERRSRKAGIGSALNVEKKSKQYMKNEISECMMMKRCRQSFGPMKAAALAAAVVKKRSRVQFLEQARVLTVLEAGKKSLPSRISGVKCWRLFAAEWLGIEEHKSLPPKIEGLLLWSRFFKCPGTFSNYCSYLQWGCDLEGVDAPDLKNPLLRRAKQAVKSRWKPKQKTWVTLKVLEELMMNARKKEDEVWLMLFLVSYMFLLRVPSEALPMRVITGAAGEFKEGHTKSELYWQEDQLILRLDSRKNEKLPTMLKRTCWCETSALTCPIHMFASWAFDTDNGGLLFKGITPAMVTTNLRKRLDDIELLNANIFTTHAFRRGHAKDMAMAGRPVAEILREGGWHSSAWIAYPDPRELEDAAVMEAHMELSDSDAE